MKLVQTLVVRDEADIVDAQLAYHFDAGVDFVIAADHESRDGTTEILESYARRGLLLRLPVQGAVRESAWRTYMAQLAASDHGADWVINTDADEFWVAREGTLKDVFAAVPAGYGVFWALSRHFVPRPDGHPSFAERMTVRISAPAAINDPTSPYRPHSKAAHRGDRDIVVGFGSHTVYSRRLRALPDWHPAEVLHFPFRTLEQYERKGVRRARGDKPLGQYVRVQQAHEQGRTAARFLGLVIDDAALQRGLAAGSLVTDTRLRDALRRVAANEGRAAPEAGSAVDAGLIAESAGLLEADVVRLQRSVDGLASRLAAVEGRRAGRRTRVAR